MDANSRLRIVVCGLVAEHPVGGPAFDYLQYVLGLADLGHDVYYHEDTWSWPYDPVARTVTDDPTYSEAFLRDFFRQYAPDLSNHWHYVHRHESHHGMTAEAFDRVAATADVFLNVSGASMIPERLSPACTTVFLDTDPGYNQIVLVERPDWSSNVERWVQSVEAHDRHVTYAEKMGAADCAVPTAGLRWVTTRMPIVLRLWDEVRNAQDVERDAWSTVMTWNAFKGPLVHHGREYGSKAAAFEPMINLPGRTSERLRVALGGVNAPIDRLRAHGWLVEDGPATTLSAESYQQFIARSRGELSVAKEVYVALRTGWFSCRTACYLAAGRPAIVQDTGFSDILPVGQGLLAFTTVEEAAEALEEVSRAPAAHDAAARELAEEHLAAPKILERLLGDVFAFSGARTARAISSN